MQPSPTTTTTCDRLLEFEEDAESFAKGEPQFVNGAAPAASDKSSSTASAPLPPPTNLESKS
jgi:hypothetical protein